ncbi:hypothetical protein [Halococcus saccharolyticus]|uniref:Uncharacterized protein n=1 Tax=Halococcus saccharolyticus DSM 5350 TaxID=1227455 RepID=M0MII2_9EURY|nr:hypothetical protein [Halococcus saccharolyticus]EMA45497.1 hypothetical protein C449_07750 [Halococcus saccharolyticus DSM 5350]
MTDEDEATIAELEQRHERLQRKAKRKPSWQRAADNAAEELIEAKCDRVEELEVQSDDMSPAGAVLARSLGATEAGQTAELRDEIDRHRSDIAELEEQ